MCVETAPPDEGSSQTDADNLRNSPGLGSSSRGGAAHIGQVFLPERPRQPRPSVRPHRADPGIPIPRTSLPRECGNPALATDLPEGPTKAKFRILGPQSPSVAPLTEEMNMRHTHLWHSTGMLHACFQNDFQETFKCFFPKILFYLLNNISIIHDPKIQIYIFTLFNKKIYNSISPLQRGHR